MLDKLSSFAVYFEVWNEVVVRRGQIRFESFKVNIGQLLVHNVKISLLYCKRKETSSVYIITLARYRNSLWLSVVSKTTLISELGLFYSQRV
jgi:hypothetical protein